MFGTLDTNKPMYSFGGVVEAQWVRPWTLNRVFPGSNLLAPSVVPLGKALYHFLVPRKGLKTVCALFVCL